MAKDTMLTGLRFSQVRLVARYWVRFSLRTGGGLMALLILLLGSTTLLTFFFLPVEELMRVSPGLGHEPQEAASMVKEISESDFVVDALQIITGAEEEEAVYLLQKQPAVLSILVVVLMLLFPFTSCIAGFNQTAGDIGSRGLRYLLLRTERPNIVLGRLLGTSYFVLFATAGLFTLLVVYIAYKFRIYPGGELVWWGLQGFVAILLVSLPYLAFCAWISSMLESAFGSLALCLAAVGVPVLVFKVVGAVVGQFGDSDFGWLQKLLPWGWKYELLSGDLATRGIAYAAMLGFTLLFAALALRSISKRDL